MVQVTLQLGSNLLLPHSHLFFVEGQARNHTKSQPPSSTILDLKYRFLQSRPFQTVSLSTLYISFDKMPSVATTVSTLLAAAQLVAGAAYTLTDNYNQANFFDEFEFFSEADPTEGFVQYQNKVNAASQGLAGFHQGMIYVGSDHKTANPANGRASTRLNSKKTYTQMLLVADVVHMPVVSYLTLSTRSFYLPTLAKASENKTFTNP